MMIRIAIVAAALLASGFSARAETKWIGGENGCMDIPRALDQWKCQNPQFGGDDAAACHALRILWLNPRRGPDSPELRKEFADAASQCATLGHWGGLTRN